MVWFVSRDNPDRSAADSHRLACIAAGFDARIECLDESFGQRFLTESVGFVGRRSCRDDSFVDHQIPSNGKLTAVVVASVLDTLISGDSGAAVAVDAVDLSVPAIIIGVEESRHRVVDGEPVSKIRQRLVAEPLTDVALDGNRAVFGDERTERANTRKPGCRRHPKTELSTATVVLKGFTNAETQRHTAAYRGSDKQFWERRAVDGRQSSDVRTNVQPRPIQCMGIMSKILGGSNQRSAEDYVELDLNSFETETAGGAGPAVQIAEINGRQDVIPIKDAVYDGDLVIADITRHSTKDRTVEQIIDELRQVADEVNGDIVQKGDDQLIITPTGITVSRQKL